MQLGAVRFDRGTGRMENASGAPIPLTTRSLAILSVLTAQQGEDVPKDALISAAGGHATVTDETLIECIGELRKVIGDQTQTLIETIPGIGYRLNTALGDQTQHKGNMLKYLGLAVALLPIILILFGIVSGFLG